jgi:large repetitive protein
VAGPGTDAIGLDLQGVGAVGGTGTVLIKNNTVTGNYQRGITVQSGQGNPVFNVTIDDNHMTGTDKTGGGLQQIDVEAGLSGSGSASTLRLNMLNNDVMLGASATYISAYRLVNRAGNTFQLQNFTGNGAVTTDVQNWVTTVKANSGTPVTITATAAFTAAAGNIPTPLLAASSGAGGADLTDSQLVSVAGAAIDRLAAAGASASQLSQLNSVSFQIVDFAGAQLGSAGAGVVQIDINGAGWGYFVDDTPYDDSEFELLLAGGGRQAAEGSAAYDRIDLMTVVLHEFGHILGYEHSDEDSLMGPSLDPGIRYSAFDLVFGDADNLADVFA